MDDDWEPRPSLFQRLLIPTGAKERPSLVALLFGLAATGTFVGSLVLKWQHITTTVPRSPNTSGISSGDELTFDTSLSNVDTLALVYLVGVLALLGLLGTVLTRPDVAVRVRMTTVGLGAGLAAIVVAAAMRMPESVFSSANVVFYGGDTFAEALRNGAKVDYQFGLMCAAATVVLLVAGLWIAGRPATRPASVPVQAVATQPYVGSDAPTPNGAEPPAQSRHDGLAGPIGRVDELTVFASEPLDPNVNPEIWRGR